jgi:hypothetical protein
MRDEDFPALYRSADELSLKSQRHFFGALKLHLALLVLAAALSIVSLPHWAVAALQAVVLLGALACSVYLFSKRPERHWYGGRAVAESIKTLTWRYVSRAEPFQTDDATARRDFQIKLREVVDQNRDVAQAFTEHLDARQITEAMSLMRGRSIEERKATYTDQRIGDQLGWYARKSKWNRRTSNGFFWALIAINGIAVICALLRIRFSATPYWPTDIFVAAAASVLSWMQAKRFSELASSYALAANEIGIVREQAQKDMTEEEFSLFVGDAENAFSREHTQWVARKDV